MSAPPFLRSMIRRPLHPIVSLAILTIGLTATITTFAYLNSFSQAIPGTDPDGLVEVWALDAEEPYQRISYLDYESYVEAARSFDAVAAVVHGYAASVRHEDMTEVAFLAAVSDRYFDVFGMDVAVGRGFVAGDDRSAAAPVAVISYDWWTSRFQGDPGVIGRTLYLNYEPFTIVGVVAPEYRGATAEMRPQVWIPIAHFRNRYTSWHQAALNRDLPLVRMYGRLAAGMKAGQAGQELQRIAGGLDQAFPRGERGPRAVRVEEPTWIDPRAKLEEASTNQVLALAVAGFLLLVCANVANLLLAVYARRRRAFALRVALGASPARVLGEVLGQNLVLAGVAGAIAMLLARPLSERLGSFFEAPSVWGENLSRPMALDANVVFFALLAALLTGIAAAVLPAIEIAKRGSADVLESVDGAAPVGVRLLGFRLPGTRDVLITGQVALSVVLLVVSALVVRTLTAASAVDPGFAYDRMIAGPISTSSTNLEPSERETFLHELERSLEREPWVESATVAQTSLLAGHRPLALSAEGSGERPLSTPSDPVHVGFFEKVGIPVLEGRAFTDADSAAGTPVAILNRPAAERFFPGESPVGRRLVQRDRDRSETYFDVVGLVGDVRMSNFLAPPSPAVFLPFAQRPYGTSTALHVNVNVDPDQAGAMLQRWLRDYEPHLAIINTIPYRQVVAGQLYTQRMNAELFTVLAILGLCLACTGIFGVVSLSVARRVREIGIRKAIGATARSVNGLIVRKAMGPVAGGVVLGVGASVLIRRFLESLLYGVEASDPLSLLAGVSVIVATSVAAALGPAMKASAVDPQVALRAEG